MLAACGGAGTETIASAPPPAAGGSDNSGGGLTNTTHTFADPTVAKTYKGVGGNHTFDYQTDDRIRNNQQGETYAGSTSTVRNSAMSIAYDPSDATYTLIVNDPLTAAATNTKFQDPASRTDFGGAVEPQWGTPKLSNENVSYLQAGDGSPRSPYVMSGNGFVDPGDNTTPPSGTPGSGYQATSLFLLKPGSETQYVTYAGFVRNAADFSTFSFPDEVDENGDPVIHDAINWHLERGAFAFGEQSPNDGVPTKGSGSYTGSMLASMIFNPTIDGHDASGLTDLPNYFQWIEGTASMAIDFASSTFALDLNGTVLRPQFDRYTAPQATVVQEGASFSAAGKGDINLVQYGGFKGFFDSASFRNPNGTTRTVAIEGSTIDGGFYGPKGQEVGGGFRIVGGNPDERVDILGAFTGN